MEEHNSLMFYKTYFTLFYFMIVMNKTCACVRVCVDVIVII